MKKLLFVILILFSFSSLWAQGSGTMIPRPSSSTGTADTSQKVTVAHTGFLGYADYASFLIAAIRAGLIVVDTARWNASADSTRVNALLALKMNIISLIDSLNWNKWNQWDGSITGLIAATGRTSLGLGTEAMADSNYRKSQFYSVTQIPGTGTMTFMFLGLSKDSIYTGVLGSGAKVDTIELANRLFKGMVISFPFDSSFINNTDTVWYDLPEYALTVDSISTSPDNGGTAVSYIPKFLYRTAPMQTITAIFTSPATITSSQAKTWQSSPNNATLPANGQVGICHPTVTTKPKRESIGIKVHR